MRRIAIINQKGGVGKTTTTVNLAAALAKAGRRVCVVDLDPQAHASAHLGLEPDGTQPSMYNALVENLPLAQVRRELQENLWLLGADINLAAAEMELSGVVGREVILRDLLEQDAQAYRPKGAGEAFRDERYRLAELNGRPVITWRDDAKESMTASVAPNQFDYLLMDCGPSLGVLTLNALACADEVFIPLQPHYLALHGLSKLLETTSLVAKRINPSLKVTGIVICLYEAQPRLSGEVIRDLEGFLANSRQLNTPWANAQIFTTRIRRNIKLAECPSFGKSIFDYAPNSNGADDYQALAYEVEEQYRITTGRITLDENQQHASTDLATKSFALHAMKQNAMA